MAEQKEQIPWFNRPIWLGVVALGLMVGGWKLSTLIPLSPKEQAQSAQLGELRRMAEDHDLARRLDSIASNTLREPPYRMPGRFLFLVGLMLFLFAGVQMYRAPAPPEKVHYPEPDNEEVSAPSSSES